MGDVATICRRCGGRGWTGTMDMPGFNGQGEMPRACEEFAARSRMDAEVERGREPITRETYEALLRYYLERDGHVTPMLHECPAAEQLVARGEATWVTCMTLGPPGAQREDGR